ncbi:MAG: class I SAM-dependent methyltransferase [Methanomicrobiaceae archaeon]|nr:class I SAM-dependent methyltransferase [Methanomicrobiaceae archaeon]
MTNFQYKKSTKYTDYDTIYEQCSGPGGLQLAEFMAEKMGLLPGKKLLDVGSNRGWQTCFMAKEYGVFAVGIDPWDDRMEGNPMVEHMRKNSRLWGVEDLILGIKVGVPDTNFASESFDYVYSTTALEMVRVSQGIEGYLEALKEIYRVLKPGGIFGLGEPMHLDVPVPSDLEPYISQDEYSWKECFRSLSETTKLIREAGFEIIEDGYAPDAWQWWTDFAKHDPFCKQDSDDDPKTLEVDGGRWTSFGYVIARKGE